MTKMWTVEERLLLADRPLPLVIRDDLWDDIKDSVRDEALKYYSLHRDAFQRGAVGGVDRTAVSEKRGDLRCWITPDLCNQNGFEAISSLVKRMIAWCKDLKTPLSLNGEYSVQLTCYVSSISM